MLSCRIPGENGLTSLLVFPKCEYEEHTCTLDFRVPSIRNSLYVGEGLGSRARPCYPPRCPAAPHTPSVSETPQAQGPFASSRFVFFVFEGVRVLNYRCRVFQTSGFQVLGFRMLGLSRPRGKGSSSSLRSHPPSAVAAKKETPPRRACKRDLTVPQRGTRKKGHF